MIKQNKTHQQTVDKYVVVGPENTCVVRRLWLTFDV